MVASYLMKEKTHRKKKEAKEKEEEKNEMTELNEQTLTAYSSDCAACDSNVCWLAIGASRADVGVYTPTARPLRQHTLWSIGRAGPSKTNSDFNTFKQNITFNGRYT